MWRVIFLADEKGLIFGHENKGKKGIFMDKKGKIKGK